MQPMCWSNLDFPWWIHFLSFDILFQVKSSIETKSGSREKSVILIIDPYL